MDRGGWGYTCSRILANVFRRTGKIFFVWNRKWNPVLKIFFSGDLLQAGATKVFCFVFFFITKCEKNPLYMCLQCLRLKFLARRRCKFLLIVTGDDSGRVFRTQLTVKDVFYAAMSVFCERWPRHRASAVYLPAAITRPY